MAVLDHHGVEHLISKIANKFANIKESENTFHVWDEVEELNISLGAQTAGIANEYLFQFTSGENSTSLSIEDDVKWNNNEAPTIESNKVYQISILNGYASVMCWNYI